MGQTLAEPVAHDRKFKLCQSTSALSQLKVWVRGWLVLRLWEAPAVASKDSATATQPENAKPDGALERVAICFVILGNEV